MSTLMSQPLRATAPALRRWTAKEFNRLARLDFFKDQQVELIQGKIVQMAPQRDLHAVVIGIISKLLERRFGESFWIRAQLPLQVDQWSEPEPDIAIVSGQPRDYLNRGHPKTAQLIVEVSETTLRFDRAVKAPLYAKAGIQDYWIANIVEMKLEIFRSPTPDASSKFGFRYAQTSIAENEIVPLFAPQASIKVSELFP